jgi:hypothetical protein
MPEIQACRHRKILAFFVCVYMSFSLITLAQSGQPRSSGPAAERFAAMLSTLEARKRKDPEANRKSTYDLLTVKVEDWYATEAARFAHALKIPNPVPADSGYRRGMTQQQYFEHLCKTEAGEFIYKTADNVDGIFQMRPRRFSYTTAEWQHLYAVEDPYGYSDGENDNPGREFIGTTIYSFLESLPVVHRKEYGFRPDLYDKSLAVPPPPDAKIARRFDDHKEGKPWIKLEYDTKPRARYGFTWRGIKRPSDRDMGIAGGELIVLDLKTSEVMGVRRGYVIWNGGWTGRVCPRYGYGGGQDKTTYFSVWFLAKVARPAEWKEFFASREKYKVIRGDPNEKRY